MTTTTIQQKESLAQFIWVGFIVMFFAVQAIVWAVAISITSGDASHAVVVGYDEQALKWDDNQSVQRGSDALGWQVELMIGSNADVQGNRSVSLSIVDHAQKPVEEAAIRLRAFHCGRAADVQQLTFQEVAPGQYRSVVRVRNGGKWQFDGSVLKNGNVFVLDQRQFVSVERKR